MKNIRLKISLCYLFLLIFFISTFKKCNTIGRQDRRKLRNKNVTLEGKESKNRKCFHRKKKAKNENSKLFCIRKSFYFVSFLFMYKIVF